MHTARAISWSCFDTIVTRGLRRLLYTIFYTYHKSYTNQLTLAPCGRELGAASVACYSHLTLQSFELSSQQHPLTDALGVVTIDLIVEYWRRGHAYYIEKIPRLNPAPQYCY